MSRNKGDSSLSVAEIRRGNDERAITEIKSKAPGYHLNVEKGKASGKTNRIPRFLA